MKIALVEDEEVHRELLCKYIRQWADDKNIPLSIYEYTSAESFLFAWEEIIVDAIFVDIHMSGMNGMDMVRLLRDKNQQVSVIFTTGNDDYMAEGYEVDAVNYLLKPINQNKLYQSLHKIQSKRERDNYFIFRTEDGPLKFSLNQINYVEAVGHMSVIGILDGDSVLLKESLGKLKEELQNYDFIKCHRSYLCNLRNVNYILKDTIVFDDGSKIPVSRRAYQKLNQAFIEQFQKDNDK